MPLKVLDRTKLFWDWAAVALRCQNYWAYAIEITTAG